MLAVSTIFDPDERWTFSEHRAAFEAGHFYQRVAPAVYADAAASQVSQFRVVSAVCEYHSMSDTPTPT